MNVNERKGKVYDALQDIRETIEETLQVQVDDVKGLVPPEWEDTIQYVEALQRHIDNLQGAVEFGVSTLDNK